MTGRAWVRALGTLLASFGAACSSYYDNLRFTPPVQDTDLRGEDDDLQGHVAVSWIGVADPEGVPVLRFQVRVDNPESTLFLLDPAEFELLDANLTSIGVACPEGPLVVAAGGSTIFDIAFPSTAEKGLEAFDLDTLTLRVRLQGGRWDWSTPFERAYPEVYVDSSWGWSSSSGCHDGGGSRSPSTGAGFAQRSR